MLSLRPSRPLGVRGQVKGEFGKFHIFRQLFFDTKKPQTDLTEWGWCGKLQMDSSESLGGR